MKVTQGRFRTKEEVVNLAEKLVALLQRYTSSNWCISWADESWLICCKNVSNDWLKHSEILLGNFREVRENGVHDKNF